MTDHYDEMRVPPDHSQAEALRQRLHARMTSVWGDDHNGRPLLRHAAVRLDPQRHLVPSKEIYMTIDSPTSETRNRRRLLMGAAAVIVVIGVAGIALANNNTDDDQTPSPPVATVGPTTTVAPSTDVAAGFLDAYGVFDADRALTYLTADAIAGVLGSTGANTEDEFRLELALLEAQGYEHTITGCELHGDAASGTGVRCSYDFHGIRSDEIGLGPYTDNYWDLIVRDGKIVSAANTINFATNGFSGQVWEPFADWVATTYPDDVPKMYTGGQTGWQLTEESVQLWDQRSREYAQEVTQSTETGTSP